MRKAGVTAVIGAIVLCMAGCGAETAEKAGKEVENENGHRAEAELTLYDLSLIHI